MLTYPATSQSTSQTSRHNYRPDSHLPQQQKKPIHANCHLIPRVFTHANSHLIPRTTTHANGHLYTKNVRSHSCQPPDGEYCIGVFLTATDHSLSRVLHKLRTDNVTSLAHFSIHDTQYLPWVRRHKSVQTLASDEFKYRRQQPWIWHLAWAFSMKATYNTLQSIHRLENIRPYTSTNEKSNQLWEFILKAKSDCQSLHHLKTSTAWMQLNLSMQPFQSPTQTIRTFAPTQYKQQAQYLFHFCFIK